MVHKNKLTDIIKKTIITAITAAALTGCARNEAGYIKEVGELNRIYDTAQFDMIIQTRHGSDTLSVYGPLIEAEYAHGMAKRNNFVTAKMNSPDNACRIGVSAKELDYQTQ